MKIIKSTVISRLSTLPVITEEKNGSLSWMVVPENNKEYWSDGIPVEDAWGVFLNENPFEQGGLVSEHKTENDARYHAKKRYGKPIMPGDGGVYYMMYEIKKIR